MAAASDASLAASGVQLFEALQVLVALARRRRLRGAEPINQQQVRDRDDGDFDRLLEAEGGRQEVDRRGDDEQLDEERVGARAWEFLPETHGDLLPAAVAFVEDLEVSADPLDVHVEREDRFEPRRQNEQRHDRAERHGDDGRRGDRGRRPADKCHREEDHSGGASLTNGVPHGGVFRLLSRVQASEK